VFTIGAILTLIPNSQASWPNLLGYRSLCTFAPIATLACCFLAGLTCVIRARFFGPRRGEKRSWLPPIILGLVFIALSLAFVPSYIDAKNPDTQTSATME
jgi:xanthine/uracil permease